MRGRRAFGGAALAASVALAAAACGSSGSTGASSLGGAASIAPSNAVAFVALDPDVSSGQWSAVDGLLRKFPAHDAIVASLQKSLEQHSTLSWANDVRPALGSELDLVALPGRRPSLVGLARGGDPAKLDALLPKLDHGVVSEQIGGWTAFAREQSSLDAVRSATTKLSDNNVYRSAVAKLAGDALVRAYANGTEAQQLLAALGKQSPSVSTPPVEWASADLVASGDGVRLNGYAHDGSPQNGAPGMPALRRTPITPYASSLVEEIPSGALLVADFSVTPGEFQFSDTGSLPPALTTFVGATPTFLAQLDDVLGGETALYVRRGLSVPEVTIVTQPNDVTAAEASLADILATLRAQPPGKTRSGLDLASIPIYHQSAGGQLIISTSRQGIADFRSAGSKLSADPSFAAARKASAMPDETTGFLYANLASGLALVQLLGPAVGLQLPAGPASGAGALKTLTAFGTRAGDETTYSVFLQAQ